MYNAIGLVVLIQLLLSRQYFENDSISQEFATIISVLIVQDSRHTATGKDTTYNIILISIVEASTSLVAALGSR